MTRRARRIHRELTPEERTRLEEARGRIALEQPELIRRHRLREEAAREPNFSGELRRAIHASELPISRIARESRVSPVVLDEFLTGETTLPTDVLDRLLEVLELKLSRAERG